MKDDQPDEAPPRNVLKSMRNVIDYCWDDELEDARDSGVADAGHVLNDLLTIRNYLNDENVTLEDLLDGDDTSDDAEEGSDEDDDNEEETE